MHAFVCTRFGFLAILHFPPVLQPGQNAVLHAHACCRTAATVIKKKDKKSKKKKDKKAAAFNSDDDVEDPTLAGPPPAVLADVDDEPVALGGGEEDSEEEAQDADEDAHVNSVASSEPSKKKNKSKAARTESGSVFALLMGEGGEEMEADVEEAMSDEEAGGESVMNGARDEGTAPAGLVVAEVLRVSPHPKADRLRVCLVDAGTLLGQITVVTNATEVKEGQVVILAPVGITTPGSGLTIESTALRGVTSHGMLCSGYDVGWCSEPDNVLVRLPEDTYEPGEACPREPPAGTRWSGSEAADEGKTAKKEKKTKKKSKEVTPDTDSLFAALALDDGGQEAPPEDDADVDFGGEKKESSSNKKKKKKKKGADIDIDALLAGEDELTEAPPPVSQTAAAPAPEVEEETSNKPKKNKKKKKSENADAAGAELEEEDLDALLAEIDGPSATTSTATAEANPPPPVAAASAGGKKNKKKKGKGAAVKGGDDEDDLDAILAELGVAAAPAKGKAEASGTEPAAAAGPDAAVESDQTEAEAAAPAAAAAAAAAAAEEKEDKEMSAAAKKKAKKKAKEKAKKEGGTAAVDEGGDAGAGGKKPAKVSAAVRRMQEAIEAKRRAEEEAARLEEEQRLKEEEEERLRLEEEERKKEEAERRKAEKAAKREQLRREGKLLTGKAKAEAERLARMREQFLRQAGIDPAEAMAPKKRPVYSKKKPQAKKKQAEEQVDDTQTAEGDSGSTAVAIAAEQAQAPEEAKPSEPEAKEPTVMGGEEKEEEEEAAADDWEALDEDEIPLPKTATAAEEEEEELEKQERAKKAKLANGGGSKAGVSSDENMEEEGKESVSSGEEESTSEEESESDSEEESSTEYSSSYDSDEDSSSSGDEMEARIAAARERRDARLKEALAKRDPGDLRSPICCILGHVDTGKTKILDNIRRTNVQDGEAGGITQQIGATYVPADALRTRTEELRAGRHFDLKLPGLLVIDTPGHESFSNLRSRGSGLCDIAVLVIDLMHGLEQQTIESINLLKMRKTPFIIALNKVDRCYNWKSVPNSPIMTALDRQEPATVKEFNDRMDQSILQLNEQGLNVALYWKNRDPRTFVNVVPTSAITGEGIPDLLQLLVKLTQSLMAEKLMFIPELQCTVLEVKQIEGLGTTIDVVLINGALHEGDTIVVCGLNGPIVTTIRALLTPQPLREIRVKGQYVHHKELRAAMGVKIAAHNLEAAVAGTQLMRVDPGEDVEALKSEVMEDMQDIFSSVDKTGEGVCVQASTLGSLEALLEFLRSPDVKIPVSAINIGPVHKRDIMRANVMIERGARKFGVILAFDVPVTKEAREMAEDLGVKVFTADIIYHLFDQFTAYLKQCREQEQDAAREEAVFPCVLRIMPDCVFNKKDPILVGVEVMEGIARVGTPLCVPSQGKIDLGRIAGLEKDHKSVQTAAPGDKVAMKIEATKPEEAARLYGRHFDFQDALVSRISRRSIDVLKDLFRDELGKDDWRLVVRLKKVFGID
jgi:translation initiation factor 5B